MTAPSSTSELISQIDTQITILEGLASSHRKNATYDIDEARIEDAIGSLQSVRYYAEGSSELTDGIVSDYRDANIKYKAAASTAKEFGQDVPNSFLDAVIESAEELPDTLGKAAAAPFNLGGNALKAFLLNFFKSLGPFGWIMIIILFFAALTYFYPQWLTAVKGLIRG